MRSTHLLVLIVAGVWLMGFAVGADAMVDTQVALRSMKYTSRLKKEAAAWQKTVCAELFTILKLDDLLGREIPFDAKLLSSTDKGAYRLAELEINSTPTRRIQVLLTVPSGGQGPWPAVVCIHGHGGNRRIVHDHASIYKGFAAKLAAADFITIAADVGQHKVYESICTLMGERLWDCMRCADYLAALPNVDPERMGCAGLSLGGEMAMWLGAMDTRMAATVSCGFLTFMDQMEHNHCVCWKFPGLRERVDFPDIYSLISPRSLQCQNGLKEPPTQFCVPLARKAIEQVRMIYRDFGCERAAELHVHDGEHEIDLPPLMAFLEKTLRPAARVRASFAPVEHDISTQTTPRARPTSAQQPALPQRARSQPSAP